MNIYYLYILIIEREEVWAGYGEHVLGGIWELERATGLRVMKRVMVQDKKERRGV